MSIEKIEKIDIKMKDGVCDAVLVSPKTSGPFPSVLMLMDAFGPRPYMVEMAQRLASHGYRVLLPNLFYRVKKAPLLDVSYPITKEEFPKALEQIMPIARAYDLKAGVQDLGEFIDFLNKQSGASGKIGITGYCLGGGLGLRAAAAFSDKVSAVASFHAGRLVTDGEESPHCLVDQIKAEIYIAHADADASMPVNHIAILKAALEKSGTKFEAETYAGAHHGFTMADLPAYNAEALERHWSKLLELFARRLR